MEHKYKHLKELFGRASDEALYEFIELTRLCIDPVGTTDQETYINLGKQQVGRYILEYIHKEEPKTTIKNHHKKRTKIWNKRNLQQ